MMKFNYWSGMPRFNQPKKTEYAKEECRIGDNQKIIVRFKDEQAYESLFEKIGLLGELSFDNISDCSNALDQKITAKTKSIWYPYKSHWGGITSKKYHSNHSGPRYPIYIVSKGRADNGLTTKALDEMGVDHYIVCEAQEASEYKDKTSATVLVLPFEYLNNYDTCDDLGGTKSKGPGAARNFCIDHSLSNGFNKHWVMDDNLDAFHYLTDNEKIEVRTGATLAATEDFVDRYSNVPVAGLNYYSFCKKNDAVPPVVFNTRIYSCLLIDNISGYRWRGRYNEDTDLSLRVLKDGLCTIQMNAFLCGKVTTQRMKGGNSKEFYDGEGTLPKSEMIRDLHPDCAKVVWRFNRWHHHVNYKIFKGNELKLKPNYYINKDPSYGIKLT